MKNVCDAVEWIVNGIFMAVPSSWSPYVQLYWSLSWNMLVLGLPKLNFINPSRGISWFMESPGTTLLNPLTGYDRLWNTYARWICRGDGISCTWNHALGIPCWSILQKLQWSTTFWICSNTFGKRWGSDGSTKELVSVIKICWSSLDGLWGGGRALVEGHGKGPASQKILKMFKNSSVWVAFFYSTIGISKMCCWR